MIELLAVLGGVLVGFSLGLTGGGGSTLAVPILVYIIGVSAHDALGLSLAAVGSTALIGAIAKIRAHLVEVKTGVLFALAGMAGAPVGASLSRFVSPEVLMTTFAGLMLFIAIRMLRSAQRVTTIASNSDDVDGAAEPRRTTGQWIAFGAIGLLTGVLSGFLGVGGGFLIVPGLVLVGRMDMKRAVGTSLLVIAMISVSGVASHVLTGAQIDPVIALLFVVGGVIGLIPGTKLSTVLSGPALKRVFAGFILLIAAWILIKTWVLPRAGEVPGQSDHASLRTSRETRPIGTHSATRMSPPASQIASWG